MTLILVHLFLQANAHTSVTLVRRRSSINTTWQNIFDSTRERSRFNAINVENGRFGWDPVQVIVQEMTLFWNLLHFFFSDFLTPVPTANIWTIATHIASHKVVEEVELDWKMGVQFQSNVNFGYELVPLIPTQLVRKLLWIYLSSIHSLRIIISW